MQRFAESIFVGFASVVLALARLCKKLFVHCHMKSSILGFSAASPFPHLLNCCVIMWPLAFAPHVICADSGLSVGLRDH